MPHKSPNECRQPNTFCRKTKMICIRMQECNIRALGYLLLLEFDFTLICELHGLPSGKRYALLSAGRS